MNVHILFKLEVIILFTLIFSGQTLYSQNEKSAYAIEDTIALNVDLFEESFPAEMTLKYNIKQYQRNKYKDEYLPAELVYHFNDTVDIKKEVRIKARGNSRKNICSFPPIWLNIKKAKFKNEYLQDTKKIKFVTHCKSREANYLFKEYLIYKIYNMVSPYSFRVRLIRVTYIDTGRKNKTYQSWAFIIEPEEMMANRLDGLPLKNDKINYKRTDPANTDIMAFFQYMIGNADYSVYSRHNIKLLRLNNDTQTKLIPVPYDFDYSGLVDANYAVPGDNLGIKSVTQRYYLGACRTSETYNKTLEYFKEKKEAIYDVIHSFDALDQKEKIKMISYLDEFYEDITSKRFIKNKILSTCR